MKALLLNPPYRVKLKNGYERFFIRAGSRWPYSEYKRVNESSLYRPFPFFLGFTAAVLKENNHQVEVIDGVALQLETEEFNRLVLSRFAEAVIIEIAPFSLNSDLELARKIKSQNKSTILIAVGPFVPLLVGKLKEDPVFDYAINGEYEFAVLEIIDSLKKNLNQYSQGIIDFKNPSSAQFNTHVEGVADLDKLPRPLYDIFPSNDRPDINVYWDVFCQLRPAVQMQTSRGCPYRCYFCLWNQVVYNNGKYRKFSVSRVVDEMQYLIDRYHAREIYFDDDDFSIDKERISLICQEILRRKLRVKWSCMADCINLNQELIKQMHQAGCIGIKFGIESADEDIMLKVGKPVNLGQAKAMVEYCKKYNIRTHATFTFGLLNENPESMNKTLNFAKRLDTDSVQFSIATPYPGTKFYETLSRDNMIADFDWMNYNGSYKCVVNYPQLSSEMIEKFYSRAFRGWLLHHLNNPQWLLRQFRILLRTTFSQSLEYNIRFLRRLISKLIS